MCSIYWFSIFALAVGYVHSQLLGGGGGGDSGSNPIGGGIPGADQLGKINPANLPINICPPAAPPGLDPGFFPEACKMAKAWMEGLKKISKNPSPYRAILTPNQQKYWDSVVNKTQDGKRQKRQDKKLPVRKELRCLSDKERKNFFDALGKLKSNKIDGLSKFFILTGYHYSVIFAPVAHFSAGLLPFHREMLLVLEIALQMEIPGVTFPYWDTTLEAAMDKPSDSVFFSDDLMGSPNGKVTSGPLKGFNFETNPKFPDNAKSRRKRQAGVQSITRAVGAAEKTFLMNKKFINTQLEKKKINNWVFCYDPFFDTVHAATHMFIGGQMANLLEAPNDPLFYMFHAFIDYLWETWRQKKQSPQQRENDVATPCYYNPFDLPNMQLFPFPIKIKDGYSNRYTKEYYTYQDWPTCENKCCNSKFLYCDKKKNQCVSKVKKGGQCNGESCYNG